MKYVIELGEDVQIVQSINVTQYGNAYTITERVGKLEELNSDYINEHYGELQDTAYQKGFEDGKAVNDKGCEGCMYQDNTIEHHPCGVCCNAYNNRWKAKQTDDEIKVGDIIANNTEPKLKVWVTSFDEIGFCGTAITNFGTVDKGQLYASCSPKGWHKIGHYDIDKILEAMRE